MSHNNDSLNQRLLHLARDFWLSTHSAALWCCFISIVTPKKTAGFHFRHSCTHENVSMFCSVVKWMTLRNWDLLAVITDYTNTGPDLTRCFCNICPCCKSSLELQSPVLLYIWGAFTHNNTNPPQIQLFDVYLRFLSGICTSIVTSINIVQELVFLQAVLFVCFYIRENSPALPLNILTRV